MRPVGSILRGLGTLVRGSFQWWRYSDTRTVGALKDYWTPRRPGDPEQAFQCGGNRPGLPSADVLGSRALSHRPSKRRLRLDSRCLARSRDGAADRAGECLPGHARRSSSSRASRASWAHGLPPLPSHGAHPPCAQAPSRRTQRAPRLESEAPGETDSRLPRRAPRRAGRAREERARARVLGQVGGCSARPTDARHRGLNLSCLWRESCMTERAVFGRLSDGKQSHCPSFVPPCCAGWRPGALLRRSEVWTRSPSGLAAATRDRP